MPLIGKQLSSVTNPAQTFINDLQAKIHNALAEVDTLKFTSSDLVAQNMLLTQVNKTTVRIDFVDVSCIQS